MTFDEALVYTSTVGSNAAYQDPALRALWTGLMELNPGDQLLEIGCEYGRSTSLILQAASSIGFSVTLIDPFLTYPDALEKCMVAVGPLGDFTLCKMRSSDAYARLDLRLRFLHIDGDHQPDGLHFDCRAFIPWVLSGGLVAFHDYGCDGLPHLKPIVDEYIKGWEIVARGETCLLVRKP